MPLNNRYVVAAIDAKGKQLAYYSRSSDWIPSVHDALCFRSQIEAKQYILANGLNAVEKSGPNAPTAADHADPVFVTEDHLSAHGPPEENLGNHGCHAGLCG